MRGDVKFRGYAQINVAEKMKIVPWAIQATADMEKFSYEKSLNYMLAIYKLKCPAHLDLGFIYYGFMHNHWPQTKRQVQQKTSMDRKFGDSILSLYLWDLMTNACAPLATVSPT